MNIQLLAPFYHAIDTTIPDLNFQRANNVNPQKRRFIWPSPPINFNNDFPIISISATNMKPNVYYQADEEFNLVEADVKISVWTKKGTSFVCDDGIERQNQALAEYLMLNHIFKTLTRRRDLIQQFNYLETFTYPTGFVDEYTTEEWLIGKSITLKAYYNLSAPLPYDVDGIIKAINIVWTDVPE